jgi:peptidyl-prolyl cis-trans isomerase D
MISWIQRSFQHHFRTVFAILLAVTIVSFIFTIGASPGIGRAGPKTYSQLFFGHDLGKQGTNDNLYGDAALSIQLQAGYMAAESSQVQEFGLQRTAALAMADQLKLPSPTRDELANYIRGLQSFTGPDGQFDANRYAAFRDNLKTNPRLSEASISRVLSDDVRIAKARQLIAGPGYVLPGEVRAQLLRADTAWTIAVATADDAAFKPEIPVSEDALKRFFDEKAFNYTISPRVGVDYVEYRTDEIIGGIKLTPADVRTYYDENPARFPKPSEPKTESGKQPAQPDAAKPANPEADFAAVQPQVEQALKTERAERMAAKAAADLTVAIYEQKLQPHTPDFADFLAKNKLTLKSAPPFDPQNVPAGLGWSSQVIELAEQLSAEHAVSDAVAAPAGSVVLFWRETLPSYQPALAQVRDRVVADYKENERLNAFIEAGRTLRGQIESRLKAGEPFEKAAAAGPIKLTITDYPAFIRRQPPKGLEQSPALAALERLDQGQLSDMIRNGDQGLFVYVRGKKGPDLAETSPQFASTQSQLAQLTTSLNENLILGELVERELKKNAPAAPR